MTEDPSDNRGPVVTGSPSGEIGTTVGRAGNRNVVKQTRFTLFGKDPVAVILFFPDRMTL